MFITPEVVLYDDTNEKEDFFCNICQFPLTNYLDFKYNKEYNCCNECYLQFVEARRKEWKEGWRPDKTVLEQYIYKRKCMYGIEE
jgi:hypothetical protein